MIYYSGAPGLPDVIGFRTRTITAADVGTQVAEFVAIEFKNETGRLETPQRRQIKAFRGRGAVCRDGLPSGREQNRWLSLMARHAQCA